MLSRWHVLGAGILLLLASACSSPDSMKEDRKVQDWFSDNGRIKVLSTVGMIEDLVRIIGAEHVDSLALVQGDLDPHTYEMVKGDGEKLSAAGVIFYNGMSLVHGASLRRYLEESSRSVNLGSRLLEEVPEQLIRVDGVLDPHVWMDISLWARHIESITQALSELAPEYQEEFRQNAELLEARMEEAHEEIRELLASVPDDKRFLVTSHDAFNYFAQAYLASPSESSREQWSKRFQAPDGLAPDGQMGVTDIRFILEHLKRYNICVLFPESNVSQDAIRKVVEAGKAVGIHLRICKEALYGDAMGEHGSKADSYVRMIRHNAEVIARHLNYMECEHGSTDDGF